MKNTNNIINSVKVMEAVEGLQQTLNQEYGSEFVELLINSNNEIVLSYEFGDETATAVYDEYLGQFTNMIELEQNYSQHRAFKKLSIEIKTAIILEWLDTKGVIINVDQLDEFVTGVENEENSSYRGLAKAIETTFKEYQL